MVTKDELQNAVWILTGVGVVIAVILIVFMFILYVGLVRLKSSVRKMGRELENMMQRSSRQSVTTCPQIHPGEELAQRGFQAYTNGASEL